jgi:hypothetical protein
VHAKLPASEYVPSEHTVLTLVPSQLWPGSHNLHMCLVSALPPDVYDPAGHSPHSEGPSSTSPSAPNVPEKLLNLLSDPQSCGRLLPPEQYLPYTHISLLMPWCSSGSGPTPYAPGGTTTQSS